MVPSRGGHESGGRRSTFLALGVLAFSASWVSRINTGWIGLFSDALESIVNSAAAVIVVGWATKPARFAAKLPWKLRIRTT